MNPFEADLLRAAAEYAGRRRLWAQTFLINTTRLRTDGQAKAAADEDHIEAVMEAAANYEIALSRLGGKRHAHPIGDPTEDPTAHDPSSIEC